MIQIHRGLAMLLLREPGSEDDQWLDQLADAQGELQIVLVEGVEMGVYPLCPSCTKPQEDIALPGGAGLAICWSCTRPFVALRFPGKGQVATWFSFPWPA